MLSVPADLKRPTRSTDDPAAQGTPWASALPAGCRLSVSIVQVRSWVPPGKGGRSPVIVTDITDGPVCR